MKPVIDKIIEGIQEKKGKKIVVVNLKNLKDAPCSYFVICEGDSKTHAGALALSIRDHVREKLNIKPYMIDGQENAEWIAIDYGHTIVHIFLRPVREFYDLEYLWADAGLNFIKDLD